MKDQWDCVLNDLEELGDQEFLVLTNQYNIKIFYCCFCFLPSCSSIHHQTNIESTQICSEDLSVSRIRSHHLLLEVKSPCRRRVFILFAIGHAWSNWAPGSISIHFLSRIGTFLEHEQAVEGLLGFALAFDRLANANTSVFVSEVSCSLSSSSLSIKSVTNVFRLWEVLTHEWEMSLFADSILNFHSVFTLQVAGWDFQYESNFGVSLNPTFRVSWWDVSW